MDMLNTSAHNEDSLDRPILKEWQKERRMQS